MTDQAVLCPKDRVLLTGGAGFIGSTLCEALVADGHRVIVLDDLSTGRESNLAEARRHGEVELRIGSVLDEALVDELMGQVDCVFHLAAVVGVMKIFNDPDGTKRTNEAGTRVVVGAAERHGRPVVFASTSEVYGVDAEVPFREDAPCPVESLTGRRWSYAAAKRRGELCLLDAHARGAFPALIFRFFNTIGPRQRGRYGMVVPRFVQNARRGAPLQVFGTGTQTRCFLHVEDAAAAIVGLAKLPGAAGQIFNIGSDREISILELSRLVLRLVTDDDRSAVELCAYEKAYGEDFQDIPRRVPDLSKIRRTLGWNPGISLEQSIERIASSYGKDDYDKDGYDKDDEDGEGAVLLERDGAAGPSPPGPAASNTSA